MKTLDAKAAAEVIHQNVNVALSNDHPTPEDRHTLAYVTDVCNHLGIEPSAHNCTVVTSELVKAGIVPHTVKEYPKVVGQRKKVDGSGEPILDERGRPHMEDVIVNSDEEETAFHNFGKGPLEQRSSPRTSINEQGIPRYDSDADATHDVHPYPDTTVPQDARDLRGNAQQGSGLKALQEGTNQVNPDWQAKQDAETAARNSTKAKQPV